MSYNSVNMIVKKSTCGLCKPSKKWKRNRTKIRSAIIRAIDNEELSTNFIKSFYKKFEYKS